MEPLLPGGYIGKLTLRSHLCPWKGLTGKAVSPVGSPQTPGHLWACSSHMGLILWPLPATHFLLVSSLVSIPYPVTFLPSALQLRSECRLSTSRSATQSWFVSPELSWSIILADVYETSPAFKAFELGEMTHLSKLENQEWRDIHEDGRNQSASERWERPPKAVAPNLLGTKDPWRARQFFHGRGWWWGMHMRSSQ